MDLTCISKILQKFLKMASLNKIKEETPSHDESMEELHRALRAEREEFRAIQDEILRRNTPPPTPLFSQSPPVYEISPPQSPPSPPGPVAPPAPRWTQEDFNCALSRINNHLSYIEKIVIGPHVLIINGINNLQHRAHTLWRERVYQLLFEAKIPFFWILRFVPDDNDYDYDYGQTMEENKENNENYANHALYTSYPPRIRLYFISHHVRDKVFFTLKSFFKNKYNNIVHMD